MARLKLGRTYLYVGRMLYNDDPQWWEWEHCEREEIGPGHVHPESWQLTIRRTYACVYRVAVADTPGARYQDHITPGR